MKSLFTFFLFAATVVTACADEQKSSNNNGTTNNQEEEKVISYEKTGEALTAWQEGQMDIHFINNTTGECMFIIFPDGTQFLIDAAGSETGTGTVGSTTNSGIRSRWDPTEDPEFRSGKFICDYIAKCMEWTGNSTIDYALLTHFHNDHFGGASKMPVSDNSPTYKKQSFPEILDTYPVGKLLDRGYPDYNYPFDITKASNGANCKNYITAVKWHVENKGLKAEMFKAGVSDQIKMNYNASKYPDFKVQNIAVNGEIWDGEGTTTATMTFPTLSEVEVENPKSVGNSDKCPEENHCSAILKITYGDFDFFAGADAQYDGVSTFAWKDMETPVAKVCGQVDVMKADHHGVNNTNGHGFKAKNGTVAEAMKYLNPRCWIINSWTDGHPRQAVYEGVSSYVKGMDIFNTNICDATKTYANFSRLKGYNGHIVVRVYEGGKSYYVYTINDNDGGSMKVKQINGPYKSR